MYNVLIMTEKSPLADPKGTIRRFERLHTAPREHGTKDTKRPRPSEGELRNEVPTNRPLRGVLRHSNDPLPDDPSRPLTQQELKEAADAILRQRDEDFMVVGPRAFLARVDGQFDSDPYDSRRLWNEDPANLVDQIRGYLSYLDIDPTKVIDAYNGDTGDDEDLRDTRTLAGISIRHF
jgi:hypothetical protein